MLSILMAGLVLVAPVMQDSAAAMPKKEKKAPDPNKKLCRSEIPTGSMMAKSVCHTRAEWAAMDAANAANTSNFHDGMNHGQR